MRMVTEGCRVVAKREVTIQKGERAGEIVFRLSLSDGEGVLNDLQADISLEVYNALICFEKLYNCVFKYEQRTFNGRSYTTFVVDSIQG
ncbi:hypothetical protein [Anaerotignum propionicum]|uniref:hypothetical protein n=1 Tax=Anaerotignum propionicum TaxID=28446 RepID=UPI00289AFB7E|nr:hypothetical protein [Anaerotignum propionicum]